MKKLITICLCVLAFTNAFAVETVIKNSKSGYANLVTSTRADITLYVRSAGNDSNDCLTSGNACLTIQEAVGRLPKQIYHDVLVDIGEGTFSYLTVSGFNIVAGSLTIQGTLNNPTLTTGTTSGTADGGSTTQCVDSGQTWTADELIGMLVLVDGEYRVPYDNDGTNIYFQRPFSTTCNGEAYEIVEQKSILTGTEPLLGYGPITLANNHDRGSNIYLYNLKVSGGHTIGFTQFSNQGSNIERCYNIGSYYGFFSEESIGFHKILDCYSTANAGAGFAGSRDTVRNQLKGCVADNATEGFYYSIMTGYLEMDFNVAMNGTRGISLEGVWDAAIGNFRSDGNSKYGIVTYEDKTGGNGIGSMGRATLWGTSIISNNTLGGISIGKGTFFQGETITGAGNGGYGIEVFSGSYVIITSGTSVTGVTGDATINDGTTTLTWATHFDDDGDIVINTSNLCVIERRD